MKRVIWKYEMTSPSMAFEIPINGAVIHVHEQNSNPCIWILVDPEKELVTRKFFAVPTGKEINLQGFYLGSVHSQDGLEVLHIFEEV